MIKRIEFTAKIKLAAFERAKGHCEECSCRIVAAEFDHRVPLAMGGESTLENAVCLCRTCHALKTFKSDIPRIAKTKRVKAKHLLTRKPGKIKSRGFGPQVSNTKFLDWGN